jgi:hypothetical protein
LKGEAVEEPIFKITNEKSFAERKLNNMMKKVGIKRARSLAVRENSKGDLGPYKRVYLWRCHFEHGGNRKKELLHR